MKYAKIDKGNGRELLVGFKNIRERAEQLIMFPYEFPDGTFIPLDYPQARRCFGFRSTDDIKHPCELCGGKTFPAAFHSEDLFRLILGDEAMRDHKIRTGVA